MKENNTVWKPVVGYEGLYEVSQNGEIRKLFNSKNQYEIGHILKPSINSNRYYIVGLYKNQVRRNFSLHRIIAMAFLKNDTNKPCVNHIDGNKINNELSNLEWCTYSENNKHAFTQGLNRVSANNMETSIKSMIMANSKEVIDIETGIFYDSLKVACITTNNNYQTAHTRITRKSINQRFKYI